MLRIPLLALLLSTTALSAAAQQPQRELFPSDFTPSPCAPATSCESFPESEIVSAAFKFLGLTLDASWAVAHGAEVRAAVAPYCRKQATCLATLGNSFTFCDDVLVTEARPLCDLRFPKEKNLHDWEQCHAYLETYITGIDINTKPYWLTAQECAKKQPPVTHGKPLEVWMSPASIPYDYTEYVTFYAIDPDTKVPVLAKMSFEDQIVYVPTNPTGEPAPYYPMKGPFKYVRVPNKEGHSDALPPLVTLTSPGYPPTTFRLPIATPHVVVEMKPTPSALHAGANEVTVFAHDSITGRPVDGRIMLGKEEAGYTNTPITITLPKGGKRPEIWLHPYLNRYSDVVLAPATK